MSFKYRISAALLCIAAVFAVSVLSVHSRYYRSHTASADCVSLPTVIIDAGHGGFDGGAVAADGTVEKELNLDVALKLNAVLRTLGFKTVMIRTDDSALNGSGSVGKSAKVDDIKARAAVMKKYPDAVFVSIHMNKYPSSQPHGSQVFYASTEGSERLAAHIQERLKGQLQPDNRRSTKPATTDIYLLHNATVTAVLAECGFLSNPEELKRLKTEEYRLKLAVVIACGIVGYFAEK